MINLRGLYDFIPRLRTIEPRLVDTVLKVLVACSKEAFKMFVLDPIRNGRNGETFLLLLTGKHSINKLVLTTVGLVAEQ